MKIISEEKYKEILATYAIEICKWVVPPLFGAFLMFILVHYSFEITMWLMFLTPMVFLISWLWLMLFYELEEQNAFRKHKNIKGSPSTA